jgi:hypothetical protein
LCQTVIVLYYVIIWKNRIWSSNIKVNMNLSDLTALSKPLTELCPCDRGSSNLFWLLKHYTCGKSKATVTDESSLNTHSYLRCVYTVNIVSLIEKRLLLKCYNFRSSQCWMKLSKLLTSSNYDPLTRTSFSPVPRNGIWSYFSVASYWN